ncbi:uncharacterized protein LOC143804169 [Ranitomeya variabilis]|uniref:uncharacterized protein LOC143804169 n=1 Tax=Ranitomeya variabilis TaxID=490064 RepID=UPI004056AFB7
MLHILYFVCCAILYSFVGAQQVAITQTGGVITFWYNTTAHVASFKFDYCDVVQCDTKWVSSPSTMSQPAQLRSGQQYICVTGDGWGRTCSSWRAVGWNTGEDWGYRPNTASRKQDSQGKSLLTRMTLSRTKVLKPCDTIGQCNPLVLNLENPQPGDNGTYLLGTYVNGVCASCAHLGQFILADIKEMSPKDKNKHSNPLNKVTAIANPTFEDILAIETGYTETNLWLKWMKYTANQYNKSNCFVCAGARPHLGSVPLDLPPDVEKCFLSLFTNKSLDETNCENWKKKYPIVTKTPNPGEGITIYPGKYTCYTNTEGSIFLGNFTKGYCSRYSNASRGDLINQTQSISDVFWICGDMKIRTHLEGEWIGECTLAKAIMPFYIAAEGEEALTSENLHRTKRETNLEPRGSFDPHIYIDAIGVPRGVPDEFKARDQVKAGFESFILPLVTINKNVDWINYIYNQQRFVNYTREALQGLADQLGPTSIMAFQNRMALDMILAEKGGVCKMVKTACCTYIPDNTGPTGKVTVAIKKLNSLQKELKKNSGVEDPWDQYFSWMKGWQRWLAQIGVVILVVLIVAAIIVCCVLPCVRKMIERGVKTSVPIFIAQEVSYSADIEQLGPLQSFTVHN